MKSEHYNVIVIPKNSSSIRRFGISRKVVVGFFFSTVALVLLSTFLIMKNVSYQHALSETAALRIEAAEFQRERARIGSRLALLEGAVTRAGRFAANLEKESQERLPSSTGQGPTATIDHPDLIWSSVPRNADDDKIIDFDKKLSTLLTDVSQAEERIHKIFAQQKQEQFLWASLPTIWPTRGWVSSEYGDRRRWHGRGRWHEGIDIASPHGSSITASGDGVVTFVGYRAGYGKTVVVDHGYGVSSLYGHCSRIYAEEGMKVQRGVAIGTVGNTGSSTGPHVHYEVRIDGVAVDPMLYIIQKS